MASTGGKHQAGRLGVLGERNFRLFFTGYITSLAGSAMVPVPLALIALPAGTALIAIAAAVAGAGLSIFSTLWETTLQREVPREVLSRVSAYDWFGSVAFVPLGYLIAAPLAALLGTRTTLFFAAAWAAGSCAIVLTIPGIRKLHTPPPSAAPAQHRHEPARAPGIPRPRREEYTIWTAIARRRLHHPHRRHRATQRPRISAQLQLSSNPRQCRPRALPCRAAAVAMRSFLLQTEACAVAELSSATAHAGIAGVFRPRGSGRAGGAR